MSIQLFDTEAPLAPLRETISRRVNEVIQAGKFILGPEVAAFEREFASYLGVAHVVGVANGTDAITIALTSAGRAARGTRCVVPSFTFYATAEAVVGAGARPVFCDIDPGDRKRHPGDGARRADAGRARDRHRRPVRLPGAAPERSETWVCRCSRTPPRRPERA